MKKLAEMTMEELSAYLCKVAGPADNLFSDAAVCAAFDEAQERMPEKPTIQSAFSIFTAVLVPALMSEKHKGDTYAILSAQTGESVEEVVKRNGFEVMKDLFSIFVLERDVQTIFRAGAQVRPE